ncbi:MAG: AbrB family transcriptional regulator [Rhodoferax sp.]|nr:AbrB family transcriptional regulator [Rhodoferax sp.]
MREWSDPQSFKNLPALWWAILLPLSALLSWLFTLVHLPAGVLLGCMAAGIWLSSRDVQLHLPTPLFALGQGVLGCLMAQSLQPAALAKVAADWPVFLLATSAVIVASAVLGWILMRRKVFPGSTAVWGLAPGAASAMVVLAESYGADVRLVAFMQYLRVAVVTATAALVARLFAGHSTSPVVAGVGWFELVNASHVGWTLLLAFGGAALAYRLRIPAGPMVLPLLVGTALQSAGWLVIELPALVLALAYAMIGWSIGLRFTHAILLHALRALPQVFASIVVLMGVGVVIAVALTEWMAIDPMTAYLASSPGGADSVAVIAATSAVDAGFVMAMQLARFLLVLVFGPSVSRLVASKNDGN